MKYNYKVCILAAGKGTRNKSIEGLHKALLPLENRTVLSHLFDRIPEDVEIVIAVGYKSSQIKSYIKAVYPDKNIVFVDIDNYDGIGSGPGYSLLCCAPELQCPFIWMPADTLTEENFNYHEIKHNWVATGYVDERYSSIYCLIDGETHLNKFYYGTGEKLFVGIGGIYDYKEFWESLSNKELIHNEHQVNNGFNNLKDVELKYFKWYDTGNMESYARTKSKFSREIVAPKINETIYIEKNKVIKYFSDVNKVSQRLERINYLNNTCPIVAKINDNMYSYDFIKGETLSKINDANVLKQLLVFWFENLCKNKFEKNEEFLKNCKTMYYNKTYDRCKYYANLDIDNIEYINGVKIEKIYDMLQKIDWNSIYDYAIPTNFHGDLQPENIIYNGKNFILIDWRESFGNSLEIGDSYYDLGKLYHALLVNGLDVNNKLYHVEIKNNNAYVSNHSRSNLLFLLNELEIFCKNKKYSWENVKLLGTLQYLGISSLYNDFHNGDYGNFLFLYGKYLLSNILNK